MIFFSLNVYGTNWNYNVNFYETTFCVLMSDTDRIFTKSLPTCKVQMATASTSDILCGLEHPPNMVTIWIYKNFTIFESLIHLKN